MRYILVSMGLMGAMLSNGFAQTMQGDLIDVSEAFQRLDPVYFVPARVEAFEPMMGQGQLR